MSMALRRVDRCSPSEAFHSSVERPATGEAAAEGAPILRSERLQVFVLIDGLGWEIIKNRPFLNTELPVRMPLKTVLGYSSGAIPTILTGRSPVETGHWNLFYYDPQGSPFKWLRWFSPLPERVLDNRVGRELIKEVGRRLMGMGPLFECCVSPRLLPLFNYIEKLNIYEAGGIPGSTSIFDLLSERRIPYKAYSYHRFSDAEILEQSYNDIGSGNEALYFLYLSQVDGFLHTSRGEDTVITGRLGWYEQQLRKIFNRAQRRNTDAIMTVVSDHGMTPVHSTYDLVGRINLLGFKMPQQYLAVYDSTMARYWFFDEAARRAIIAELKATTSGKILSDSECKSLGVFFPDRRYGEIVFLLDPGWLFAHSDFNGSGWNPAGMHGYHPSDPNSNAIFLSNRPIAHPMRTIADIYWCLEEAAS
ncbi:MAG: alkaline phosphatase family protein [Deltaproteobacteria bacterium]|nr:alkaline phosphatase family protein [Deltaproteobacteria bacterium]